MKKWFRKYGLYAIAAAVGTAATPAAIHHATLQRGYTAVGGEYFLIPFAILVAHMTREAWKMIKESAASAADEKTSRKNITSQLYQNGSQRSMK